MKLWKYWPVALVSLFVALQLAYGGSNTVYNPHTRKPDYIGFANCSTAQIMVKDATGWVCGTATGLGAASVLTGYISGAGTVAGTDTILQAIQKLNGNFEAAVATGSDGSYYLQINNNSARTPDASVDQIYPEANVWKVNQNGTESSVAIGPTGTQINFAGTLTNTYLCTFATGGTISCNTDPASFQAAGSYLTTSSTLANLASSTMANLGSVLSDEGTGFITAASNAVDGPSGLATYGHTVQYAATPTIDDPDNWTMSGAGMYGGTWIANAAGTGNLPAVAAGMNLTVTVEGTGVARLNPNGSEVIYLNGTACSAGYDIYNSGTTGDSVVLQYRSSGAWLATAKGWSCGS